MNSLLTISHRAIGSRISQSGAFTTMILLAHTEYSIATVELGDRVNVNRSEDINRAETLLS